MARSTTVPGRTLSWRARCAAGSRLFALIVGAIVICCSGPNALCQSPVHWKVGAIVPLTGPIAEYGVAARNGFLLAQKEHPELFDGVDFIFDDSGYDSAKALSSFHKFRASQGALLAYVWGYGPSQAIAPVAEAQKFPIVAASAERSVSAHRHYTLRFNYHIEQVADALLTYLRSQGMKKVLVVKTELAYMDGLLTFMSKKLKAGESIEVVDTFQPEDMNFKTTINKLKNRSSDVVGVFLTGQQASQFYREMKQVEFTPRTIGTDFFDSMQVVRDAQGAMTGAVFAAPFVDPSFVARYLAEFGNDTQVAWAASSYEFAVLTGTIVSRERGPIASDRVINLYTSFRGERGSAAKYVFTDSPEGSGFDFRVIARRIDHDRIVDVDAN